MVVEGGIVGPQWRPGWLPISTNEMRAAYRAQMLPGITDIFLMAQRGFLDVGFIGGAQIDRLRQPQHQRHRRATRGRRSGCRAAAGPTTSSRCAARSSSSPSTSRAASSDRVDFITSPGYLDGRRLAPAERARSSAASPASSPRSASSASSPGAGACASQAVLAGVDGGGGARPDAGFEVSSCPSAWTTDAAGRPTTSWACCAVLDPDAAVPGMIATIDPTAPERSS